MTERQAILQEISSYQTQIKQYEEDIIIAQAASEELRRVIENLKFLLERTSRKKKSSLSGLTYAKSCEE